MMISNRIPSLGLAALWTLTLALPCLASDAGRTLEQEAVIPAPVADVWDAFATAEGMLPWMRLKAAEVDLRVGGAIRTSYTEEVLGGPSTIVQRILSYEPERMLSLQLEKAPEGAGFDFLRSTWAVMYFESLGPSETRIRIVGLGYGTGPEWDRAYAHFEQANPMVFELLKQHLSSGQSSAKSDPGAADP